MPYRCDDLDLALMAYADGEATPAERALVEVHLAACPRCTQRLATWRADAARIDRVLDVMPRPALRRRWSFEHVPVHGGQAVGTAAGFVIVMALVGVLVFQIGTRHVSPVVQAASAPAAPIPIVQAAPAATATPFPQAVQDTLPPNPTLPPSPTVTVVQAAVVTPVAEQHAATLGVVPVLAVPPAPAPPPSTGIAFARDGALWLNTGDAETKLDVQVGAGAPRWSASGKWLLYEVPGTGDNPPRLWWWPAIGSHTPVPVPAPAASGLARWSPVDDVLAVASPDGALWLVQPDGGAPVAILGSDGDITNLAWAPSGKLLAVERRAVGAAGQSVWLVSVTGQVRAITSAGAVDSAALSKAVIAAGPASFSPNQEAGPFPVLGSWNATSTALTIWLSPTVPRGAQAILPLALWTAAHGSTGPTASMYPYRDFMSWSPDGAQLALAVPATPDASGNSSTQLVVANASGGKPEVVSAATQTVGDLAWSPDGHYIAYAANNTGAATAGASGRRIWLVTPDGAERRPVTLGPDDEFPQWSRDGKTLVYVHQTANGAEVWSVAPAGKDGLHRVIAGLVGLHDLARQFFGASGLISYRGIFAWSAAAPAQ